MAIMDVFNHKWFQNFVWRLREHRHWDRLECLNRTPDYPLAKLLSYAENEIVADSAFAVTNAANHMDLFNCIDRHGGLEQQFSLQCICTDEQKAMLDAAKNKKMGQDRDISTRNFNKAKVHDIAPRDWLDINNPRVGIYRDHEHHNGDPAAIREGVQYFCKYLHHVLLQIASSTFGKKLLHLAWWAAFVNEDCAELVGLQTVFELDVLPLNRVLEQESAKMGPNVWKRGSISVMATDVGGKLKDAYDEAERAKANAMSDKAETDDSQAVPQTQLIDTGAKDTANKEPAQQQMSMANVDVAGDQDTAPKLSTAKDVDPVKLRSESKKIALVYMAQALQDRYPQTKWDLCEICKFVNGIAWDSVIGRKDKLNLSYLAGSKQTCPDHPLKFGTRVKIAQSLDGDLLYLDDRDRQKRREEKELLFAETTQNGFDFPLKELDAASKVVLATDKSPTEDSLACFAYRAQLAQQWYETWTDEIQAHYVQKRAKAGQALTPPAPAQAHLINTGTVSFGP